MNSDVIIKGNETRINTFFNLFSGWGFDGISVQRHRPAAPGAGVCGGGADDDAALQHCAGAGGETADALEGVGTLQGEPVPRDAGAARAAKEVQKHGA